MVKRYGTNIQNLASFTRSVLSETLAHHLHEVCEEGTFDISPGLVHPREAPTRVQQFLQRQLGIPAGTEVWTSLEARAPPLERISKRDVVLAKSSDGENYICGQVWFLTSIDQVGDFALIDQWQALGKEETGCATWRIVDRPQLIKLNSLLTSVIWSESADCHRTFIPYQFRGMVPRSA